MFWNPTVNLNSAPTLHVLGLLTDFFCSSKPPLRSEFYEHLSRTNLTPLDSNSLELGPCPGCSNCSHPSWVDVAAALSSKRPNKASDTASLSFKQSVISKVVDLN